MFAQLVGSSLRNEDWKTLGQHRHRVMAMNGCLPESSARIGQQDVLLEEGFVGWNPRAVNANDILWISFFHDKPSSMRSISG